MKVVDVEAAAPAYECAQHRRRLRRRGAVAVQLDDEIGPPPIPVHAVGERMGFAAVLREPPRQHHALPRDLVAAVEHAQRPPAVEGEVGHQDSGSPRFRMRRTVDAPFALFMPG